MTDLVNGFYWIDLGSRAVVAERATSAGIVRWYVPGREEPFTGDHGIDVLAGPLALPNDPVDEANVHTWLSVCRRLGLDAKRATLEDVDRLLAQLLVRVAFVRARVARFVAIAAGPEGRLHAVDESGRVWWRSGEGWTPYSDVRLEGPPAKPEPRPPYPDPAT